MTQVKLPFLTLLLLISFASVNAVLFTPALPSIAQFFEIGEDTAQQTITWFLIGYALGQLFYGPLANRFGRKPALYVGITVQIISSLLCVVAGYFHAFWLLVLGRFLLAFGSAVGLKMTFTLVNESYEPSIASRKMSYLMIAFAITPGLGVAFGGILNTHYGWMSCFYAGAVYGALLFLLVRRFTETQTVLNLNALKIKTLLHEYGDQLKNIQLIASGLLMGTTTCFVYVFAAIAPFVAMNIFGMNSTEYGMVSLLPPFGLMLGGLVSAQLSKIYSLRAMIRSGISIACLGVLAIFCLMWMHFPILYSLFLPMMVIYFGLCFIMASASTLGMSRVSDKSHASAVMNFINIGLTTLVVLSLGLFSVKVLLLPTIYLALCVMMLGIFTWAMNDKQIIV